MPTLPLSIHGQTYRIACDEGQEAHLERLGAYLNERCEQLAGSVGHIKEDLLLVMAALLIADELSDVTAELQDLRAALGQTGATDGPSAREQAEERVAQTIEALSRRVETIAQTLQAP